MIAWRNDFYLFLNELYYKYKLIKRGKKMVLEKYKKYKEGMAFYVSLLERGYSPDSKEMRELLDTLNQLKAYAIMSDRLGVWKK